MKNPNDAAQQAKGGGSTRNRRAIFGERKTITLRMTAELNERLMGYCDTVHAAANTYVNALIESALAKTDPAAKSLKRVALRAAPKVIVSIRLEPDLHQRLNAYCERAETSANAFVCGLVQRDLKQRGR